MCNFGELGKKKKRLSINSYTPDTVPPRPALINPSPQQYCNSVVLSSWSSRVFLQRLLQQAHSASAALGKQHFNADMGHIREPQPDLPGPETFICGCGTALNVEKSSGPESN